MPFTDRWERIPKGTSANCSLCRRLYKRTRRATWWKWQRHIGSPYETPVPYCKDCRSDYRRGVIEESRPSAEKKLERLRKRRSMHK